MLDHLVFAGPDLPTAVAEVARLTGVTPVPGGSHIGLGTANHLASLGGNAYLEVIGPDPDQPEPVEPRPFGIDTLTTPKLVTWAVRPGTIGPVIASARQRGYDPGDGKAMSRRTADGQLLSWRLTPAGHLGGVVPFLIDWGETPHPTSRRLPEIPLVSFTGVYPRPAEVRTALAALGVELDVKTGQRPELVAVLRNLAGEEITLR